MDRKLKKRLLEFTVPPYDDKQRKETLLLAEQMKEHRPEAKMSGIWFFFDQLRFIRKRTWLLKIAATTLLLAVVIGPNAGTDSSLLLLGAVCMPLLCLINARELWDLCQPGLLELQMTVRNPLRQVLLIRLTAFGSADLVILFLSAAVFTASDRAEIWQVLLYGTVPYFAMCAGCMVILKKWEQENGLFFCGVWSVLLGGVFLCVENTGGEIYSMQNVWIWAAAEVITIAGMVRQMTDLVKKSGGNVDEINAGTAV